MRFRTAPESFGQFIKRVEEVQAYNPELTIQHILPTLWDVRSRESQNVLAQLQEHFGDKPYTIFQIGLTPVPVKKSFYST